MSHHPYLIVSDTHLGAVPDETERAFRRFLAFAGESSSGLLINGDLFDFWFEYGTVILRDFYRTLAALKDVVEAGVPVSFVGGNHDGWAGSFLRDEIGITLLDGPAQVTLAGRRALVAHGDGVGEGDYRYRALKWTIRNPVFVAAFRIIHPDVGTRLARLASSTEHKADSGDRSSKGRARFIQDWAEERLREDPTLELVVAGHAHAPAVVEVEPGRFYVNAGDWIRHFSYLALPAGGGPPELRYWPRPGSES
ncbi:MAG TPA: UDP-2,3-diacylglucosamine diphosphatase [Longimicrobiaceae bacterium]|nr:UDP-2,3-diacylglucosamine diphosphatase [Longimicrobiaceae bacterium]